MTMVVKMAMIIMIKMVKIMDLNTGNEHIGFNNSVFLSERDTADR